MKNLTLEHLSSYLPWGLDVEIESVDGKEILPLTAITVKDGNEIITLSNTDYYLCSPEDNDFNIKPILRPLSDLTIKYYWDNLKDGDCELSEEKINEIKSSARGYLKLYQLNYLFKHHFDVFGLIESGSALNINDM